MNIPTQDELNDISEAEIQIENSIEFEKLESLRLEIHDIMVNNEVDYEDMKTMLDGNLSILQKSDANRLLEINHELSKYANQLIDTYPEIRQEINNMYEVNLSCLDQSIFNKTLLFGNVEPLAKSEKSEGMDCATIPYVAGLILCTKAGPVFYWPCAAIVICNSCEGDWVDDSCEV